MARRLWLHGLSIVLLLAVFSWPTPAFSQPASRAEPVVPEKMGKELHAFRIVGARPASTANWTTRLAARRVHRRHGAERARRMQPPTERTVVQVALRRPIHLPRRALLHARCCHRSRRDSADATICLRAMSYALPSIRATITSRRTRSTRILPAFRATTPGSTIRVRTATTTRCGACARRSRPRVGMPSSRFPSRRCASASPPKGRWCGASASAATSIGAANSIGGSRRRGACRASCREWATSCSTSRRGRRAGWKCCRLPQRVAKRRPRRQHDRERRPRSAARTRDVRHAVGDDQSGFRASRARPGRPEPVGLRDVLSREAPLLSRRQPDLRSELLAVPAVSFTSNRTVARPDTAGLWRSSDEETGSDDDSLARRRSRGKRQAGRSEG